MKYFAFACLVLLACKPASKTTAAQSPAAPDKTVTLGPHVTVYKMTGSFASDTTSGKH